MGDNSREDQLSSLYTQEVKNIIHGRKPPYPGFILDVAEYETYITLRFYRENFHEFSDGQMIGISLWLTELMTIIRVITPCYLEVFENVPVRR